MKEGRDSAVLPGSTARHWAARVGVLVALVLTVWFAGPRAWRVLSLRVAHAGTGGRAPRVELDRVGFVRQPEWLAGDLLVTVMSDLSPLLRGQVPLVDDAGARQLELRLGGSPWVEQVSLRRRFPDRLVADLVLRRPVLEVWLGEESGAHVLVDRAGVCLPAVAVDLDLPRTVLGSGGRVAVERLLGQPHPDPRVVAAAAVAAEWRDELVPRVPGAPALQEVDAGNLGYRLLENGRWSEILVALERPDGGLAVLAYGHPPDSQLPRVPLDTKAQILRSMLVEFPELAGVDGGDLRFVNRWRDWVRPCADAAARPR